MCSLGNRRPEGKIWVLFFYEAEWLTLGCKFEPLKSDTLEGWWVGFQSTIQNPKAVPV